VLVPERARQRTELYQVAFTDENGRFTFSGIAPGDYKVFSWDGLEDYGWFDPELLGQSEARGRSVHVTETSTETVEVTAIPAGGTR
jgi:protocatechuate 3,4-dioxygenase beta subunit